MGATATADRSTASAHSQCPPQTACRVDCKHFDTTACRHLTTSFPNVMCFTLGTAGIAHLRPFIVGIAKA
eukprot:3759733-Rhodomonas_salina.1